MTDYRELIARAEQVQEGVDPYLPWDVEEFRDDDALPVFGVYAADSLKAQSSSRKNAEFIAASRSLIPELVSGLVELVRLFDP